MAAPLPSVADFLAAIRTKGWLATISPHGQVFKKNGKKPMAKGCRFGGVNSKSHCATCGSKSFIST
jgi:hypothetical protein